jgi:hypothetical protein
MNTSPRNLPRFLPTLTEVVQPSDLMAATRTATITLDVPSQVTTQRTLSGPESQITPETSALVSAMVEKEMQIFRANLQRDLETMVRHAVQEALNLKPPSH